MPKPGRAEIVIICLFMLVLPLCTGLTYTPAYQSLPPFLLMPCAGSGNKTGRVYAGDPTLKLGGIHPIVTKHHPQNFGQKPYPQG